MGHKDMRKRGLTKRIASAVTTGGPHPRTVRMGSRLHLWMIRRFGDPRFLTRDVLVLTTTGRRSGEPRSTPLYYVRRGDGTDARYYVAASFAGRDAPPVWYLNLVANPQVSIQIRGSRIGCRARVLEPGEADAVWPLLDATYRPFARYRRRTDRVIPVIELAPAPPPSGGRRVRGRFPRPDHAGADP
jgi:F420H(2)-dependent quinone reductase